MKEAKTIGLTGQTGAGKSTIAAYAARQGCAVIEADLVAREALEKGSDCLKRLAKVFGYDIIAKDGSCNRKLLAERAFAEREKTDILNSITHPWIIRRTKEYIGEYKHKNYDIILFDAPQLFESRGDSLCDYVIAVTAPERIRTERIMKRDGLDEKAAKLRINAQHDEKYYTERADYIIDGSENPEKIKAIVYEIISHIKNE